MSDPLKELIKRSVLSLLEARQYEQARLKYSELTKEITLASERRNWDEWFDDEVRRYIVPDLVAQGQHEQVMEIYKEQKARDAIHPHSFFDVVWKELLEAPEQERQEQIRKFETEERERQSLEKFESLNRKVAWGTAIVTLFLGLISQHALLMLVGAVLVLILSVLEIRRQKKLRQQNDKNDPIRSEYERRKRAGENR